MKWLNGGSKVAHKVLGSDGHLRNGKTPDDNNNKSNTSLKNGVGAKGLPNSRQKHRTKRIQRRNNVNIKHSSAGEFDANQVKRFIFLQSRIYWLSSLIGDRQRPYNSTKGVLGLMLWIFNLTIHFALDFYEANTVFHVSWASSIGVFLVMFIISTIFLIRHTVRWFIKTLKKLSKDKIYCKTFVKLSFIFKLSPYAMFILSVSGAGAQYGCYAYDDALTVSFTKAGPNGTKVELVPNAAHIVINVARFTSLMHIYYMMFLLLGFALIIFFTIVHTQRLFNAHIGNELKAHPPSMTFQEAVDDVAMRTKLLRSASENTTIIFSTLLLATSLSFVVNAYNFLFIKRYAIYIWFAIAPLIWTVSILIGSAFVTSSYQKLKLVVMQSWVEIPEKYDELWSRRTTSNRINTAASIRKPTLDWRAGLENMRRRKAEREATEHAAMEEEVFEKEDLKENCVVDINEEMVNEQINVDKENEKKESVFSKTVRNINLLNKFIKGASDKSADEIEMGAEEVRKSLYDNVEQQKDTLTVEQSATGEESSYKSGEEFRETTETGDQLTVPSSDAALYSDNPIVNEQIRLKEVQELRKQSIANENKENDSSAWKKIPRIKFRKATKPNIEIDRTREEISTFEKENSKNDEGPQRTNSVKFDKVVRLAQQVNKFTDNTKRQQIRRKFNYEKYIKYLELTLDTVGFSLGKVTITWDRVSFFIVLLMTLVGVFAQNAFLK
ncbi:uncharacterized protein [Clytia hemisphaerica]